MLARRRAVSLPERTGDHQERRAPRDVDDAASRAVRLTSQMKIRNEDRDGEARRTSGSIIRERHRSIVIDRRRAAVALDPVVDAASNRGATLHARPRPPECGAGTRHSSTSICRQATHSTGRRARRPSSPVWARITKSAAGAASSSASTPPRRGGSICRAIPPHSARRLTSASRRSSRRWRRSGVNRVPSGKSTTPSSRPTLALVQPPARSRRGHRRHGARRRSAGGCRPGRDRDPRATLV